MYCTHEQSMYECYSIILVPIQNKTIKCMAIMINTENISHLMGDMVDFNLDISNILCVMLFISNSRAKCSIYERLFWISFELCDATDKSQVTIFKVLCKIVCFQAHSQNFLCGGCKSWISGLFRNVGSSGPLKAHLILRFGNIFAVCVH